MPPRLLIAHWRSAKHSLDFVQQEVVHEDRACTVAAVAANDVVHASEQERNPLLQIFVRVIITSTGRKGRLLAG